MWGVWSVSDNTPNHIPNIYQIKYGVLIDLEAVKQALACQRECARFLGERPGVL